MAASGAWRYDDTARQRVENIFHLYDTNGSGELELNEYYMLDHIIHRFDRKDLSRLARKQADSPAMSWESDEDDERVEQHPSVYLAACTASEFLAGR